MSSIIMWGNLHSFDKVYDGKVAPSSGKTEKLHSAQKGTLLKCKNMAPKKIPWLTMMHQSHQGNLNYSLKHQSSRDKRKDESMI